MKIIDKIRGYKEAGKPFYSFEYFPPKTDAGLHNLYARLDRMSALEPAFIDITWGAGGSTKDRTFEFAKNAQTYFGLDVMMHLTCTNMKKIELAEVLQKCLEAGITNIMALRGDPASDDGDWKETEGGLNHATELVTFIKKNFHDAFCIGVAAYPEAHLESKSVEEDIKYLKEKQDCGADFAVTQLFYNIDEYKKFLALCDEAGITFPIVPGLLPIQNYQRFNRFSSSLGIDVPKKIGRELFAIQTDDAKVQAYGIELGTDMCKQLIEIGVPGIHFYTLNLESSVTEILEKLGFSKESRERRSLPWRKSVSEERQEEDVRPIFWSNRPKSYLARTTSWDDFPNGRWGDARSPTYGALEEYYRMRRGITSDKIMDKRREMWGSPKTDADIGKVFARYCSGQINELPWCDSPVQAETGKISQALLDLNMAGYWTINSQPQVNAASSSDPDIGWGGSGGYVFQKEYVEFFTSQEKFFELLKKMKDHPSITYQAVDKEGNIMSNTETVNAVTWGVFPGREVIQPTVVDPMSFMIWKDEAFDLWSSEWKTLYKNDTESAKLLDNIQESYYLVNLVENDFVNGDLFSLFS
jgi:methylenetetrahydrofolate reductase (NADPH)